MPIDERAEHPFVRIGAEEIDVRARDIERKSAERLDGVERKEDAALVQQRADGIHVDPVAAEKMAARQGDESGLRGERRRDEFRGDFARRRGLEIAHGDSAPAEFEPRIDVRGVIAVVAEDLVALAPRQAIGEEAEARARSGRAARFPPVARR